MPNFNRLLRRNASRLWYSYYLRGLWNYPILKDHKIKASWKKHSTTSLKELFENNNDSFWKVADGGTISWSSMKIRCLSKTKKLPRWFFKDQTYPELLIILLNNGFTYKEDPVVINGRPFFRNEIWSSDNSLIEESLLHRACHIYNNKSAIVNMRKKATFKKGIYIYLGCLRTHYGHFLLESLARLWPFIIAGLDKNEVIPVIHTEWPSPSLDAIGKKYPFVAEAYQRIGINLSEIYEIVDPVIFEKLLVPTPSFRLGQVFHYGTPTQSKVWAAIKRVNNLKPKKNKIYLSRKKHQCNNIKSRFLSNELEVEQLFIRHGFEIVYPERLPFTEQVKLYQECSIMAGPIGSCMHNSAFMPDDSKVLIIAPSFFSYTNADSMINTHKNIQTNYFYVDVGRPFHRRDRAWMVDIKQLETRLVEVVNGN